MVKNLPANAGDSGLIPGLGLKQEIHQEGNGIALIEHPVGQAHMRGFRNQS